MKCVSLRFDCACQKIATLMITIDVQRGTEAAKLICLLQFLVALLVALPFGKSLRRNHQAKRAWRQ